MARAGPRPRSRAPCGDVLNDVKAVLFKRRLGGRPQHADFNGVTLGATGRDRAGRRSPRRAPVRATTPCSPWRGPRRPTSGRSAGRAACPTATARSSRWCCTGTAAPGAASRARTSERRRCSRTSSRCRPRTRGRWATRAARARSRGPGTARAGPPLRRPHWGRSTRPVRCRRATCGRAEPTARAAAVRQLARLELDAYAGAGARRGWDAAAHGHGRGRARHRVGGRLGVGRHQRHRQAARDADDERLSFTAARGAIAPRVVEVRVSWRVGTTDWCGPRDASRRG
jgi:hypothetical protein